MNNFADHARTLANCLTEAGISLSLVEAISLTETLIKSEANFSNMNMTSARQNELVIQALSSPEVMVNVREGKKIDAIRAIRTLVRCSLKEAKDAIEDPRVWNSFNL